MGSRQYSLRFMTHIGRLIEQTLHEQGRTVTWFAKQLCCTRPNVYKLFQKESLDTHLLWRISMILHCDFFRAYSLDLQRDHLKME